MEELLMHILTNLQLIILYFEMSSFMLLSADEYSESTKTEEEIKQLIMTDQGSIQKNMIYILTRGHPLQRPYVYKSFLPYWKELLPYVLSSCLDDAPDNQVIISESLVQLIKQKYNELRGDLLNKIFNICIQCINRENWNVNQKWGIVLQTLLQFDSENDKLNEIQRMSTELGKASQPIISRVTAGRLISIHSKYIKKLKPSMIDTLKGILSCSQSQPKLVWLKEFFPKLLKNCEFSFLEMHLQQKLMESVYDKNQDVGISALELIMKNCQLFSREEKRNRIAKLFVDALTSKNQKTVLMITRLLGEIYQKLQEAIRSKQQINVGFWESLMELSQSKNSAVLNNFLYNLPGILKLSKTYYNIEPISEVYIGLFYQNLASKPQLLCCFHEMVQVFPNKREEFKEIIYDIFEEALDEQEEDCEQIYEVINILLINFDKVNEIFLETNKEDKQQKLEQNIVKYLVGYWTKLQKRRNGNDIEIFHRSLSKFVNLISYDHLQVRFIPKLFSSLKLNLCYNSLIISSLIQCMHQVVGNINYISGYISKIFIELGKSVRSFQRETALRFMGLIYNYFSIQIIKQLKITDKLLYFSQDKSFKVRYSFITLISQVKYFLTSQELVEYDKVMSKYRSSADEEITIYIENHKQEFDYDLDKFDEINERNIQIREGQKLREMNLPCKKGSGRRDTSLFKEARSSLKDQTLKMYNKKKIVLNQFATISKPQSKQKKKFKITTKIPRKA